jgi:hypothetical protein
VSSRKDELTKAQRIKDPAEKEARIAELERESEYESVANLPDPVLYPIDSATRASDIVNPASSCKRARAKKKDDLSGILYDEYADDDHGGDGEGDDNSNGDGEDAICTGIPHFPLIMRVDIQGKFGKEKSVMAFHSKFGSLPARAMLDLTEMMYRPHMKKKNNLIRKRKLEAAVAAGMDPSAVDSFKAGDDCSNEGLLPEDIFLPEPEIVQAYRRLKMFKPDEFTMDAFRKAGCDAHLLNHIMGVVRNATGVCVCLCMCLSMCVCVVCFQALKDLTMPCRLPREV